MIIYQVVKTTEEDGLCDGKKIWIIILIVISFLLLSVVLPFSRVNVWNTLFIFRKQSTEYSMPLSQNRHTYATGRKVGWNSLGVQVGAKASDDKFTVLHSWFSAHGVASQWFRAMNPALLIFSHWIRDDSFLYSVLKKKEKSGIF